MGIMREGASVVKKNDAPRRGRRYFCTTQFTRNLHRAGRHYALHIHIRKTDPISFIFPHLFSPEKTLSVSKKHIIGLFSQVYCEYSLFLVEIFFCKIMLLDDERIRNWLLPSF